MSVNSFEANTDDQIGAPQSESVANPLTVIQEALHGLQFGQVTIIVQDGVVVQVERTEKRRLKSRTAPG